jgi:transposase-like protein
LLQLNTAIRKENRNMPGTTSQSKLQLWRERLKQFGQSQQSVQQFCASLGCTPPTFHYWRRKLEVAGPLPTPSNRVASSSFVPVVVRGGSSKPLVVNVKDGTRIVVPVEALTALQIVLEHSQRVAQ